MRLPCLLVSTAFRVQVLGLRTSRAVFTVRQDAGKDHLSVITRGLDRLLAEAGVRREELASVLADAGPGSFTGIRIGMIVARTVAQALRIPMARLTSLEALAVAAGRRETEVFAVKDAGRGRIYTAGWRLASHAVPSETVQDADPAVWLPETSARRPEAFFCGDCGDLLARFLPPERFRAVDAPSAEDWFAAAELFGAAFGSWKDCLPVYVRRSDAEERREARP